MLNWKAIVRRKNSGRFSAVRTHKSRDARYRRAGFEPLECRTLLSVVASVPNWVPEGPQSITLGDNSYQVGAINQIAVDPNNPVHLLAATVNGGVWQTPDFTAPGGPSWTTTTDLLPSLSIECVAFSPVNSSVIYAGTGQYSSESAGDAAVGVYKSIDGGAHWQVQNPNGIFTGLRIIRIIPTKLNSGLTVFAATTDGANGIGGVFRSDDGGTNWNCLSHLANRGDLPDHGVTDLVENPNHPNQFFAGVTGANAGVYELDVTGGNTQWKDVTDGNMRFSGDLPAALRIVLSISPAANPDPAGANPIWAAVINSFDYQGVYRGVTAAGETVNWTEVGPLDERGESNLPPDILNGNGPTFHGAIVADPQNDNFVYLDGNGGPVVRGSSSDNTWTAIGAMVGGPGTPPPGTVAPIDTGVTTSPHRDYRGLVFTQVLGNTLLLESDDGGVYKCTDPEGISGADQVWTSINGNIQDTEGVVYSYNDPVWTDQGSTLSYDQQFHIIFGGAQDVGVPTQNAQDSLSYQDQSPGTDGGDTAVDNFSRAGQGESTRYFYGCIRRIYTDANTRAPSDHDAIIFPSSGLAGLTSAKPNDLFNFSVVNAVAGQIVVAGIADPVHACGGPLRVE